jgi:hypothetical protein
MTYAIAQELQTHYAAVHRAMMAGPKAQVQAWIDDGTVWQLEGSLGRMAMALLESGECVCAPEPVRDFYGTIVPAYWMVEDAPGSQGSVANAEAYHQSSLL